MQALLKELPVHQGLAGMFATIGSEAFWRSLVATLRLLLPADNALVVLMAPERVPQVLADFDFSAPADGEELRDYCNGMYLLDPFYQAACAGIADGLHWLEHIAPDQFRQSEYYQSYFQRVVGRDEVQFMLNHQGAVISLSLGCHQALHAEQLGALLCVRDWVLAAMHRHLQLQGGQVALSQVQETQLMARLEHFTAGLSERESETARLILQGFSSKAIAQRLGISPETVKVHRRNLYQKLKVASHAELFALFLQQGTGRAS